MSNMRMGLRKYGIISINLDPYRIFICLIWAQGILADYVRAAFMRVPILRINNGYLAIYVIYATSLLFALPRLLRHQKGIKILLPLAISLCYVATYLVFPQNTHLLDQNAANFFLQILPMVCLGFAWDTDDVMNVLYKISGLTIFFSIIYTLFIGDAMSAVDAQYSGDMDFAYRLLPHICLVAYYALAKANFFNIAGSAAGAILLFSLGTRGAVLCLVIFLALIVFLLLKSKNRIIFITATAVVAAILLTGNRLLLILTAIEPVLQRLGLSNRIIDQIREGVIFESVGRSNIQSILMNSLTNHELFGYGIFGDRILTNSYAHNFVLELMVDFGVLVGVILFVALIILIIKKYAVCTSGEQRAFLILLFCTSVVSLMLSGSYLTEPKLFLLIGICMNNKKRPMIDGEI